MSDINTPEPDEPVVANSSAAEQGTDSMKEAQPSIPTAALSEQPSALERTGFDDGGGAEKDEGKEASAAPLETIDAETIDADEEVPIGDSSSTIEASVKIKEEMNSHDALLDPLLLTDKDRAEREDEPIKAESNDALSDPSHDLDGESAAPAKVADDSKAEKSPADTEKTNCQGAEVQEDTSMQEPTSIGDDAPLHEESSRAPNNSIPQPATFDPHDAVPEQPTPLSNALENDEAATKVSPPPDEPSDRPDLPTATLSAAEVDVTSAASVPVANSSTSTSQAIVTSIPAFIPAGTSTSIVRRPSPGRVSMEAQEKARQEEALRLQKENEDMRLRWLSLPANDHLTYYSDTEDDASANESNGMPPKGAYGGMPLLSRTKFVYGNGKRKREDWLEDERESSDSEDENLESQEQFEERQYCTGNRGNKLLKGSRWNRRGKLGLWTEAKNEKEMHDRFMSRVKAIQRAGVESLLYNAPGPKAMEANEPIERDMLEGSDRLLYRDVNKSNIIEENLQSTSLAPALLRPILTARALLESHTLRHTFRNPHIGALSKTALDLRESEGHLSRALGRCFSAMERMSAYVEDSQTGEVRVNGSQNTDYEMDVKAIGAEGTAGTADEVNPALIQLDDLFVTKTGLPIPVANTEGEEQARQSMELQAVLTTNQQRDVIRAALECLQDLGLDSLEYVERLDEVRGRLEGVKRRRTQVWEALRLWALKREGGEDEDDNEGEMEEEEIIINSRPAAKTAVAANASAPNRRRR